MFILHSDIGVKRRKYWLQLCTLSWNLSISNTTNYPGYKVLLTGNFCSNWKDSFKELVWNLNPVEYNFVHECDRWLCQDTIFLEQYTYSMNSFIFWDFNFIILIKMLIEVLISLKFLGTYLHIWMRQFILIYIILSELAFKYASWLITLSF